MRLIYTKHYCVNWFVRGSRHMPWLDCLQSPLTTNIVLQFFFKNTALVPLIVIVWLIEMVHFSLHEIMEIV